MAYNDVRGYYSGSAAAQNIVATASGQVVTDTAILRLPVAEAAYVVGLAVGISATPSAPPSAVHYDLLSGTTTIGTCAPLQTAGSAAYNSFTTPVAVAAGSVLTIQVTGTGTASATETAGAAQFVVAVGPQFV